LDGIASGFVPMILLRRLRRGPSRIGSRNVRFADGKGIPAEQVVSELWAAHRRYPCGTTVCCNGLFGGV
jgi:hypothetical protein